jgi:hypothetical protein
LSEDFGGSNPSLPTAPIIMLVLPKNGEAARNALIAQLAEHTLGKGEVTGSNLVEGSVAGKHFETNKESETWRKESLIEASRI